MERRICPGCFRGHSGTSPLSRPVEPEHHSFSSPRGCRPAPKTAASMRPKASSARDRGVDIRVAQHRPGDPKPTRLHCNVATATVRHQGQTIAVRRQSLRRYRAKAAAGACDACDRAIFRMRHQRLRTSAATGSTPGSACRQAHPAGDRATWTGCSANTIRGSRQEAGPWSVPPRQSPRRCSGTHGALRPRAIGSEPVTGRRFCRDDRRRVPSGPHILLTFGGFAELATHVHGFFADLVLYISL